MEDRKPNKVVGENIPRIHGDCAEIEDSVVDPSIDGGHDVSGYVGIMNLYFDGKMRLNFVISLPVLEIWFASAVNRKLNRILRHLFPQYS